MSERWGDIHKKWAGPTHRRLHIAGYAVNPGLKVRAVVKVPKPKQPKMISRGKKVDTSKKITFKPLKVKRRI